MKAVQIGRAPARPVVRAALVAVLAAFLSVSAGLAARPAVAAEPCTPVVRICPSTVGATAVLVAIPGLGAAKLALDKAGAVAASAGQSVISASVAWFTQSMLTAAGQVVVQPGGLAAAAEPSPLTAAGFIGRGGAYHSVASAAVVLLVAFIFLGVIQGLLGGEPSQALFRLVRDTPLAILAILGFPWLVGQLLDVADGLCAAILPSGVVLRDLLDKMVFAAFASLGAGLPQMLLAMFVFLATVLVFAELVVRSALVLLLVALAPLSFAGMVWPAARPAARKVVELVAAAVLAKPAIYLALKVGLDLVAQRIPAPDMPGWGSLLVGVTVVCLAAFAPWVVWRLLPLAEAFMVAQGVSRMPARAGMQAMQVAYWADMIHSRARRAGGGGGQAGLAGRGNAALGGGPGPTRSGGGIGGSRGARGGSGGSGGGASPAGTAARAAAGSGTAVADRTTPARDGKGGRPHGGDGIRRPGRPSDGWVRRPPPGHGPGSRS